MYFIANWKMYGSLNSLNSVKKVIKLSKKTFQKLQNLWYRNECENNGNRTQYAKESPK